jgi:hypothetical protein
MICNSCRILSDHLSLNLFLASRKDDFMRWIMSLLLCALCTTNLCVAEEVAEQTPEQALEPVLEQLRADDISRAFLEMSILGLNQTGERVEEALLQRKKFRQIAGKSLGEIELLDVNRVGSRLVRLTFTEHSERYLMVWRFTMYRGSKQWRIIAFNYNDELGDLFEKSKQLSQKPENLKR